MGLDLLLRDVRRRADSQLVDLAIDGGEIVQVGPALGIEASQVLHGDGSLVLPGLVNAHQHLDKTLIGDELRPGRWGGPGLLRHVNRRHRETYTVESVLARAETVAEMALGNGTTHMRAFTDIEPIAGLTGTRALVALRERYAGEMAIQVVAFPQETLFSHNGDERLLEQAIDEGADVIGGFPSGEATDERTRRHVDFCLDLARRRDLDIHMLLDDTDDPSHRSLEYLALRTIEVGWEGRVTVGHAGALSAYDQTHALHVIERVRDAGISVCVNAHISLVLQGRDDRGPIRRGTTRVRELLEAGVNVLAAQDDVDDPYYPLGRADQLEVAAYTAHVCHLIWPDEIETVMDMVSINAARALRIADYGLDVGDRANVVVVGAPDTRTALAEQPPRRYVISHGRLVSERRIEAIRHPRPTERFSTAHGAETRS
jgi:cytosine deaminase